MHAIAKAKGRPEKNNELHRTASRCCAVLSKAEPNCMHKRKETGSTRDFRTTQYIHKYAQNAR